MFPHRDLSRRQGHATAATMWWLLAALLALFAPGAALAQDAPAAEDSTMQGPPPLERFVTDPEGDQIRIVPKDVMTVEENLAYGGGRTIVYYGERTLEADRLVIDLVTLEAQAEGNVIVTGKKELIRAKSVRYNFRHNEGVAFGAEGRYSTLYFKAVQDEDAKGPSFRQVSEVESIFRGTQMTACDFPVPHYYVRAREVIVVNKQKILFRRMAVYLRGIPVFYFPWYARTFESSPWDTQVGYTNILGFWMHVGYRYVHELRTPDWENPKKYNTRTSGQLDASFDYFSKLGPGAGFRYAYGFNYEQHRGDFEIYGVRDGTSVDVLGGSGGSSSSDRDTRGQRFLYRHRHNSRIGRTIWQYEADWLSDPDLYRDVVDRVTNPLYARRRLAERSYTVAATYFRNNWLARVMMDHKERIGRDRYEDYSEPYTDDLDYEADPDRLRRERGNRTRGLSGDRYGVVRDFYSARVATSMIKLWNTKLYWRSQFNAFQALDSGYNTLDTEDDDSVTGIDFYNSLTHRIKFSERYTWTNTLGIGVGSYTRGSTLVDDSRINDENEFEENIHFVDTLRVKNAETIYPGQSDSERAVSDADSLTLWADIKSRLNARFADTLQGSLTYTNRRTMGQSLGEFYESIGRVEAREDIYDIPSNYHWADAFLNYYLLYPNLDVFTFAGANLGEVYANQQAEKAGIGGSYRNETREFTARTAIYYQTRQVRDPSDPNAFRQGSIFYTAEGEYSPVHRRWWAKLRFIADQKLDQDPADNRSRRERDRYNDNRTYVRVVPLFGGQVGPKHIAELSMTWDSRYQMLTGYGLTVTRDLHDAELSIFVGEGPNSARAGRSGRSRTGSNRGSNNSSSGSPQQLEFRVQLKFKVPGKPVDVRRSSITTLRDRPQDPYFVE